MRKKQGRGRGEKLLVVERDWDVNTEHCSTDASCCLKVLSVLLVCSHRSFWGGFAHYSCLIVLHIRKYSFIFILFFSQEAEEHLDVKTLVLETLHSCCQTLPANHVKHRQHLENFYDLFCYSPLKMLQTERLVREYLMHVLFRSLPNSSACWEF